MELIPLLQKAITLGGSDVFIMPGSPVMAKVRGAFTNLGEGRVSPSSSEALVREAYALAARPVELISDTGDDDFSFSVQELSRFRCNAYKQRGTFAATLRIVAFGLPDPATLGIPDHIMTLADRVNGMILVTGPAGSGKSTTLACLVDRINSTRCGHIVTVEDPIEFLHRHKKSLVSQREVPTDAATFPGAVRAALRQAPDVIMLGEMRDTETVRTALTAAETGHLVLSSLHTVGAAKTIDRIIDAFPAEQQAQARMQLSMVLVAVVSQRLVPALDGTLVPVFECMDVNPAIRNMIRDGRTHQIDGALQSGPKDALSMDNGLLRLYQNKRISRETALTYAVNPELLAKKL